MKKILVTLASLAIALAANFGMASAHPFRDPTPSPETTPRVDQNAPAAAPDNDVEVEADQVEPEKQQAEMNDVDEDEADEVENEDEANEDEDKDEADENDEDDNDKSAAGVATPARTLPVMTTGKGEHDGHGDGHRDRSGNSGHDGDDD